MRAFHDFSQTSDDEVFACLGRDRQRSGSVLSRSGLVTVLLGLVTHDEEPDHAPFSPSRAGAPILAI